MNKNHDHAFAVVEAYDWCQSAEASTTDIGSYTSLVYFLCRCYRRHRSLSWPSRNMVSNLRRSLPITQRGISRYLSLNMLVSSNSLKQFTTLNRSCTLLTLVPPYLAGFVQSLEFLKKFLKFAQQFSRPGKRLENRDKVWKLVKCFFLKPQQLLYKWFFLLWSNIQSRPRTFLVHREKRFVPAVLRCVLNTYLLALNL